MLSTEALPRNQQLLPEIYTNSHAKSQPDYGERLYFAQCDFSSDERRTPNNYGTCGFEDGEDFVSVQAIIPLVGQGNDARKANVLAPTRVYFFMDVTAFTSSSSVSTRFHCNDARGATRSSPLESTANNSSPTCSKRSTM